MRRVRLLLVCVVMLLGGCGGSSEVAEDESPAAGPTGEVRIFAAASLTDAFNDLGRQLEAKYPGLKASFNFAASSALARQLSGGERADVFASADEESMRASGSAVESPTVLARNRLSIVVEKGNPKGIETLKDLAKPGTVVVLCAAQVPCGTYADEAIAKARVVMREASREENVKSVLTKVSLGEADAGIVYATDVIAGGEKVEGITIPVQHNVTATLQIALLQDSPNAAGARAFLDLVTSPAGHATLQKYGFTDA